MEIAKESDAVSVWDFLKSRKCVCESGDTSYDFRVGSELTQWGRGREREGPGSS